MKMHPSELVQRLRASSHARAFVRRAALFALLAVLVLAPKVGAVVALDSVLWGDVHGFDVLGVLAQDLVLFWFVAGVMAKTLHDPSRVAFHGSWVALFALTFLLATELRVRAMWLSPLELAHVRYFFAELASIRSSVGTFFEGNATVGISARRWFFVTELVFACAFGLALRDRRLSERARPNAGSRRVSTAWFAVLLVGLLLASRVPRQMYSVESTLFVGPLARALGPSRVVARPAAVRFEQPERPLRSALASPRLRLSDAPPLTNLVLVVLESFRWKGHALPDSTLAPNLARLAREGLVAKAYVPVPHSSKGLYATITGRYPSSSVEIREAAQRVVPSLFRDLAMAHHATTYAFSTAHLAFENLEGLLGASGIDRRFGPSELRSRSRRPGAEFSYGVDDAALVDVPAAVVREDGKRPFAALMITSFSHHPYFYPGKIDASDDGLSEYERAIAYADETAGRIVGAFEAAGLADGTLFVFVGDHGESFGEHGVRLHNNSLYEEEITVPLVFWTNGGRLHHDTVLRARQIDVAPTIADLLGATDATTPVQGVSLLRVTEAPAAFAATFFDGVAEALIEGDQKYLYLPASGRLTRFDLRRDPDETSPTVVRGREAEDVLRRLEAAQADESARWAMER